jgi:hypothetical protein
MYLGITKLAELIVLAAKNVSEKSWCTQMNIGPILGIKETDNFFGEINVMDDSGYRYIVIGNTKNNLTVIRGRKTKKEDHMCYMFLYWENCEYQNNKEIWKYECFPEQNEIAKRLQKVYECIPLISMDKHNSDSDEFWYEIRNQKSLEYLSKVVKKYADVIAADERSAEEIFADRPY